MTAHALKMASHLSRRRFLERGALLALGSTAVLAGAPTAAASARRESRRDSPDVCAEFCQPINSGPCGCLQCDHRCYICNGCGDIDRLRCFPKSYGCTGFCWKPVC
jgi:hypothetical protein